MPCPPGDAVTELLLEKGPEKIRAALIRDGELFRYEEEAPGAVAAEDILVVRVDRCVPALEAAFVKMGPLGTGYLPYQEMRGVKVPPRSGEKLLAQVKKAPVGSKQAYLTMDIALAGRGAVLLPLSDKRTVSASVPEGEEKDRLQALCERLAPEQMGLVMRREAANMDADALEKEIAALTDRWRAVLSAPREEGPVTGRGSVWDRFIRDARPGVDRVLADFDVPGLKAERVERPFERYGVWDKLRKALRRVHHLPCGGNVVLEKTEAMWVADVNSARAIDRRKGLEATALKVNTEAAREIARLCQVRNVGGILVADFVDMEEEDHRREVAEALEEAFRQDPRKVVLHGFTALGLFEITRKKDGEALEAKDLFDKTDEEDV